MQLNVSLTIDLETAAGRAMFAQLSQLLPSGSAVSPEPVAGDGTRIDTTRLDPEKVKANRQQAAANARAAKLAKQAEATPEPAEANGGDLEGQLVGDDPTETPDDDSDLGLDDPSMSPAEAKDAGLALLREVFATKPAEVKKLQKAWNIAKFHDVPMERGHEFYQQAMKLAQDAGLRK
jgi:hypothetical protein